MPSEESPKFTSDSGSAIKPVYAQRSMKCMAVTESELKQIGLANFGVTVTFGLGSALIAFGLDLFKDQKLATSIPENALSLIQAVQPMCWIFGIVFWIISFALWWWRRDMLRLIREESK